MIQSPIRARSIQAVCIVGWLVAGGSYSCAQTPLESASGQRFLLSAPNLGTTSQAVLSGSELQVIGADGTVTRYQRESRFDSADRGWLAFYSRSASQILRWPSSHSGHMQIGRIQGGSVVYRTSQMSIQPVASPPRVVQRPVLPPVAPAGAGQVGAAAGSLLAELAINKLFDVVSRGAPSAQAQMLRLASYDSRGAPWVLTRGRGFDLSCINRGSAIGSDWYVTPSGGGFVRVETYDRGRVYAIGAKRRGNLALMPLAQDPHQLWRVTGGGRGPNQFVLENVGFPGRCLSRQAGGQVLLQPISYAPNQMWLPYTAPAVPAFQPFARTVSTEVLPNSQLPPARLDLKNTHRYALVVLLGDSRQGDAFEQIRIEPGAVQTLSLERDAGATVVERVETRTLGGGWQRQEFVTAIPPAAYYDLSVYEEHLQSIAIDATGTSPNPIEDVNYVPKSVGWLPLPPGAQLPARGELDVYPRALAANNPGAVRRMDPRQFDEGPTQNPLESILEKYQSVPRKKF